MWLAYVGVTLLGALVGVAIAGVPSGGNDGVYGTNLWIESDELGYFPYIATIGMPVGDHWFEWKHELLRYRALRHSFGPGADSN